jgi:hypothetical protein
MEMKHISRLSNRFISIARVTLLILVCGTSTVSQNTVPNSGQRNSPPLLGTNPNGGMLQKVQPSTGLRPAVSGNDVEQMTSAQFRALPDSSMLLYKGQSLTKSAFIQQRLREFQLRAQSTPPKTSISFEMLKAQFRQKEAAALAQKNARVEAIMAEVNSRTQQVQSSPAFLALAKESAEIQRRYSDANPAQQAQLKQRALEIHNQLLKIEQEPHFQSN